MGQSTLLSGGGACGKEGVIFVNQRKFYGIKFLFEYFFLYFSAYSLVFS